MTVVGHSSEGRPLKVVRIGSGDRSKPAVFIDGGIHARWVVELLKVTKFYIYLQSYKALWRQYVSEAAQLDGRRLSAEAGPCHNGDILLVDIY